MSKEYDEIDEDEVVFEPGLQIPNLIETYEKLYLIYKKYQISSVLNSGNCV